jgi:hypothetical protein
MISSTASEEKSPMTPTWLKESQKNRLSNSRLRREFFKQNSTPMRPMTLQPRLSKPSQPESSTKAKTMLKRSLKERNRPPET